MISIIASFLIPWLIGWSIVVFLFPVKVLGTPLFFRLSLALGLGLGVSSSMLFLWLLVFGEFHYAFKIVESAIGLTCLVGLCYQKKELVTDPRDRLEPESSDKIEKLLGSGFCLLGCFGLVIMSLIFISHPHGFWDGWAIWNNRARFLFRSGNDWMESFSPLLGWSHPDYPLLIPLSIARCWFYLGAERPWVSPVLALLFSVSTTGLLVSALSALKNKSQGYLGGIILLGTPFFLWLGASQYADVPLSFFFLSVLVIFYIYDQTSQKSSGLLGLGGILAGFSAWTKNEGLLFIILLFLVRFAVTVPKQGWKEYGKSMSFFMMGLFPILFVIGCFKILLPQANYIISMMRTDLLFQNLTNPGRYYLIAKAFSNSMLNFGHWPMTLIPVLILYFIWGSRSFPAKKNTNSFLPLILQFFGYFLTFLITPLDLGWQLGTALDRLFMHLWPGFLFAALVFVATPEEVLTDYSMTKSSLAKKIKGLGRYRATSHPLNNPGKKTP